ncbi:MAG: amino acid adenylation domain-containing protein [Endozoicomonas sp.]|uniref:amino acid adenylation domain-containing protein n=1 Tax=Endozoicomonas sp. TaxID=1892382 RepID=UPI003D9ADE01
MTIRDEIWKLKDQGFLLTVTENESGTESIYISSPQGTQLSDESRQWLKSNKQPVIRMLKELEHEDALWSELGQLPETTIYPLSPTQTNIWFDETNRATQHALYNATLIFTLHKKPNIRILNKALCHLIRNHDVLRISVTLQHEKPFQTVSEPFSYEFKEEQITKNQLERVIEQEASLPFQLDQLPLFRAKLVTLMDEDRSVFLLTLHHLLIDGISLKILSENLSRTYKQLLKGTSDPIKNPCVQFTEYCLWRSHFYTGARLQHRLDWWQNWLQRVPEFEIPGYVPVKNRDQFQGSKVLHTLSDDLSDSVKSLAQKHNSSPFLVLLSTLQLLLHRWSGQKEFAMGIIASERNHPALAETVGCLVNTLPVKVEVHDQPYSSYLIKTSQDIRSAVRYMGVPLNQILRSLGVSRVPGSIPLIRVLAVMEEETDKVALNLDGQPCPARIIDALNVSRFDLCFRFLQENNRFTLSTEFQGQMLEPSLIANLMNYLEHFLKQVTVKDSLLLSQLSLIPETFLETFRWQQPELPSITENLLDLFQKAVREHGQKTAIKTLHKTITYQELDQSSSLMAIKISNAAPVAGSMIALWMNRGHELITAMLACLKLGAAWIPITEISPAVRVHFLLEDTQAALCIVDCEERRKQLSSSDSNNHSVIVVTWQSLVEKSTSEQNLPKVTLNPDSLACLLYTSGTTGNPKGVMTPHRAIIRLVIQPNYISITDSDHFLFLSNPSFDASLLEIWGALLNGAKLVIPEPDIISDNRAFAACLEREAISILWLTAGLFDHFARHQPSLFRNLRALLTGGDILNPELVSKILKCPDGAPKYLINGYGPTENTTFSTTHLIFAADCQGSIPLGRPIRGTQVFILDQDNNPLPPGIPGEICFTGEGLALGYWHRPDEQKKTFLPAPYWLKEQDIIYKSGDRGYLNNNGVLMFLGRTDRQVKIRGFRVELDSVENALEQCRHIEIAAANAREVQGRMQLVGWYQDDHHRRASESIRQELDGWLPDYMIPSLLIAVETMPLNSNGKIRYEALPDPLKYLEKYQQRSQDNQFNVTENVIASIWKDVLGLHTIQQDDNFFSIGGDSILCIQIIARAREQKLYITQKQFYANPTISTLAHSIRFDQPQDEAERSSGILPLLPMQKWLLRYKENQFRDWVQTLSWKIYRPEAIPVIKRAFEWLVQQHDSLNCSFSLQNTSQQRLETAFPLPQWFEFSADDNTTVDIFFGQCLQRLESALDIENKAPVAGGIATHGKQRWLLVSVHHFFIDSVSWQLFDHQLQETCSTLIEKKIPCPMKGTHQLRQISQAISGLSSTPFISRQLPYWLEQVQQYHQSIDSCRAEKPEASSWVFEQVKISQSETKLLLSSASDPFLTSPQTLLLAGLLLTTEQRESHSLALLLEGHGRTINHFDQTMELTTGWFTALYPVCFEYPKTQNEDKRLTEAILSVKVELLNPPDQGSGYNILRWEHPDPITRKQLAIEPSNAMTFNFLGQSPAHSGNTVWQPDLRGMAHNLKEPGRQVGACNWLITISEGELVVFCSARSNYFEQPIRDILQAYLINLKKLIRHGCSQEITHFCYCDFPACTLPKRETEHLIESFGQELERVYDLSPTQHGILFHSQYDLESTLYQVQISAEINGPVDKSIFRTACRELFMRHRMLRTLFLWQQYSHPVQVVLKSITDHLTILDWKDSKDPKEQWLRLTAEDASTPFDIAEKPPIRIYLAESSERHCYVMCSMHHILMGGWCFPLLIHELETIYTSQLLPDHESSFPAVKVPEYEDFLIWLQSKDKACAYQYWQQELSSVSEPTPLGLDRKNRPAATDLADIDCGQYQTPVKESLYQSLTTLAHQEAITLNTLFQFSWSLILSRYSDQKTVLYGTAVSGREQVMSELDGIANTIGLFINTLPVCFSVQENQSVSTHLKAQHGKQQKVFEHGYVALSEIAARSELHGNLFDSLLVFENYPMQSSAFTESGRITHLEIAEKNHYPLTIQFIPLNGLKIRFLYHQHRIETPAIKRLAEHFISVLEQIVTSTEQPLRSITLQSRTELKTLNSWQTGNVTDFPSETTIDRLICQQIERTPVATAVEFGEQALSYQELMSRAEQYQHLIIQNQSEHEKETSLTFCIGVACPRGLELLPAILGVLKAGAAYVPMDINYPRQRLQIMAHDSDMSLLITVPEHKDELKAMLPKLKILSLHKQALHEADLKKTDTDFVPEAKQSSLSASSLVNVIFTSGSTGRPKAVMTCHRALINRLFWMIDQYSINSSSRILQKTPISFDVSGWELLLPLFCGATVVMAEPEAHKDPDYLESIIQDKNISDVHFVPSMLNLFLESCSVTFPNVRNVYCSGEALPQEVISTALKTFPKAQIHNLYGPTEAAIDVSYHTCSAHPDTPAISCPIGQPVQNTELYVLNSQLQPQPIGIPGELCIGGIQVSRGYLNRDDLTRERFLKNPFAQGELYRTGDQVFWNESGELEFLGRQDGMIKLRGQRLELGEIEAVLTSLPDIRQCCVTVQGSGERSGIAAYCTVHSLQKDTMELIRQQLSEQLPEFMLPSWIIPLTELPLTPSGKLDYQALPAPEQLRESINTSPLLTPLEKQIASIWGVILGHSVEHRQANFFSEGGHSLLAARVISRLSKRLQKTIPISLIFKHPVLYEFAKALEESPDSSTLLSPARSRNRSSDSLPLSYCQERFWFFSQLTSSHLYNIPLFLKLSGDLDINALEIAFNRLLTLHEILSASIKACDGEPRLVFNSPRYLHLQVEGIREDEVKSELETESQYDFVLDSPPLYRLRLLLVEDSYYILILNQHHLITDGHSSVTLMDELSAIYRAKLQQSSSILPVTAFSYRDYILWEKEWVEHFQEQEMVWWHQHMMKVPELNLPNDRPYPPVQTFPGERVPIEFSVEHTRALNNLANHEATTLFNLMASLFAMMLSSFSQQKEFCLVTPVTTRNYDFLEGVAGCFINTLPLRISIPDAAFFSEFLEKMTQELTLCWEHRQLPFEKLIASLGLAESRKRAPLAQVMIVVNPYSAHALPSLPDVDVSLIAPTKNMSQFELTLYLDQQCSHVSGLSGWIEYNTDLFHKKTIQSMADHFLNLVDIIIDSPDTKISTLPEPPHRIIENVESSIEIEEALSVVDDSQYHRLIEVISEVWAPVLGIPSVPNNKGFFTLGGNSFLMVRVQARLKKRLPDYLEQLSLVHLFTYPTVASLAQFLSGTTQQPIDSLTKDKAEKRHAHLQRRHQEKS